MNNKTIIAQFGFRIIGRIMEIEEGVILRQKNSLVCDQIVYLENRMRQSCQQIKSSQSTVRKDNLLHL